jgi:hypothetical protein
MCNQIHDPPGNAALSMSAAAIAMVSLQASIAGG